MGASQPAHSLTDPHRRLLCPADKVKKEKVTAAPKKGEKRVVEGEAAGSPEHGSQAAQPSMELWAQ